MAANAAAPSSSSSSSSSLPRRIQEIPARTEYRFELEPSERIAVRLVAEAGGKADVFGHELSAATSDRWYSFGDEAKVAISSLTGCQIEIVGQVSTEYLADETSPNFSSWSNLHLYLEKKRLVAREALKGDLASGEASKVKKLASSERVSQTKAPRWTTADAQLDEAQEGADGETSAYTPEGQGPRIMVLGPEASGKSSLIKFLANYALRSPAVCDPLGAKREADKDQRQDDGSAPGGGDGSQITGWWPTIVSLDSSAGTAPLPCTMSILPLSPVPNCSLPSPSPAYPYGLTPSTSGAVPPSASTVQVTSPSSFWLGQETARANERHSKRVVDWLAHTLERRLARDERARCSGILVDMPGVATADSRARYAFVQHCVRALHIDTIVILGHEKLNIEMSRIFGQQGSGISVVKIPKSGGVVELDQTFKHRLRALQVRNYFYGGSNAPRSLGDGIKEAGTEGDGGPTPPSAALNAILEPLGNLPSLSPYSTTIPFDLLEIYKIGDESAAPSSALPIGASRALQDQTQLIKLNPSDSTLDQATISNAVLALVQPVRGGGGPGQADSKVEPPPADDEIIGSPILGFIHVASIDAAKKKMTILSPSPGKLPSKTALFGTLDWQDA